MEVTHECTVLGNVLIKLVGLWEWLLERLLQPRRGESLWQLLLLWALLDLVYYLLL